MVQLGSLDERSLRRVVAEFLEGGDVSAAVAKEVKEKEMRYERDPNMRLAGTSGTSAITGNGSGQSAGGSTGNDVNGQGSSGIGADSANGKPLPVPDAATLAALRRKQSATLAGTVLLVIVLISLAVFLTA